MGDITIKILTDLWNTTEESTWDSLLYNLDEIHERDIITTDQWEDLHYALKELKDNYEDFPDSIGELRVLLQYYL